MEIKSLWLLIFLFGILEARMIYYSTTRTVRVKKQPKITTIGSTSTQVNTSNKSNLDVELAKHN